MPGRVASASTRTSRRTVATKASTRSARNSSPPPDIPDEGEDSSLRRAICTVFADSQKSTAAHRKAIISLRKVQEACCYEPVSNKKGKQHDDFDEDDFNREVVRCVIRILPVKKSEPVGDRVVRFLGTFLNVAAGKDNEIAQADDEVEDGTLPQTPTSRLASEILKMTMLAMKAKAKEIRFRATQITSHIINSLDTLDDALFHQLRQELLKRLHDKEASVRLQAVYGLGRLAAEVEGDEDEEDSDSDEDLGGKTVLNKLLNVLQNDSSAEVRRNLLLNLPLTKEVLPYLLERARDADATTRKALYSRLLPALGDFRHLSLTHREKLLRWGLRDRDENVRKATARLFCERWIEDCAALPAAQAAEKEEDGEATKDKEAVPSLDALLELLERIDVVNSGGEGGIALIAMDEFWKGRPDYVDYVSFPDSFWDDLSPELAFVARTFNDYCRNTKDYVGPRALVELAEEKLPEVTKFGFLLEREIKKLIQVTIESAEAEDEEYDESELAHCEFVVEQLLHMALTFDYSDEVGRRKISVLMRSSLALPDLPEEVTRLVVEVLRLVCGEHAKGEREFCSVVLEAVAEVHDTIIAEDDGDIDGSTEDSFHSATEQVDINVDDNRAAQKKAKKQQQEAEADPEAEEERAVKELMVNMKCLHIAMCMLQNVHCDLTENVHLVTTLNTLVVPAVRSKEAPLRERGLLCLGLCCFLGKQLAGENLTVFIHCFSKGHPALQTICLQIITDMLVTHPSLLTPAEGTEDPNEAAKPVLKMFKQSLKSGDPEVQSTGATALSKAMLSRLIVDADLLKQLVVTYFDPDSITNPQLRQSLSYFFPVYCHSRAENAVLMAEITTSAISKLLTLRKAFEDDDDEDAAAGADQMVSMTQITNMLLDWTDPRKIVGFSDAVGDSSAKSGAGETHFILAESILDRLVSAQLNKDEKKILFSMLNKLHLPAGGCDAEKLKSVLELLQETIDTKVAADATSKNVLTKLQTTLLKLMHDVMTEERGGGDTVLETTELPDQSDAGLDETETTQTSVARDGTEVEEEADDDSAVTQLQQDLKDATLGATTALTFGPADAEGTRIQLEYEDSEMMDIDG
ncbi:Condensin complex subunit 3 [Cercospora beticola]|uniref:Condensin complex subunit 3 n=1 Tax=Cercospora beticola TaxID=122368 RepID=A0A2G5HGX0_CERBT|nr:Condensin complex subunit 3 [Cercospora beticola]PIA91836.1 Condensin complex subunit 3 [Cercospora beticola]WPB06559.1 hypothetical protein RHO25_011216 [Cercospora beticola]CAK1366470.1 unnamed protein product [Cercospora beticola]